MPRRQHLSAVPDAEDLLPGVPEPHPWSGSGREDPSARPGPRLPSLLIDRPRLLERLEQDSPLMLVRAPLGYGKTTLLAQGLRARTPAARERAVWMRVSDDAAGGQRFWRELAFALERAGIEVNGRRNSPDPARAQVRRALAGIRFPVILVIDGFERVTEDSLDTALLEIVRDSPMLRLVVSLRSWRHFRPMQYVDIDTVVIDATDLLFVQEETEALLYEAGVEVAPAVAARIHREVLGRPEPVRAIALRLMESGGVDNAEVAKQVAADYMRDRLLPAVGGRDIFEFVLAISLLDPVPLGLADGFARQAAGSGPSALALLEVLERQGFLQRSADGVSPIFHWPPLSGRGRPPFLPGPRVAPPRRAHRSAGTP
jgi:LuxR family maltose regulon positive regulatory protein